VQITTGTTASSVRTCLIFFDGRVHDKPWDLLMQTQGFFFVRLARQWHHRLHVHNVIRIWCDEYSTFNFVILVSLDVTLNCVLLHIDTIIDTRSLKHSHNWSTFY
jgi:hypothetical protein